MHESQLTIKKLEDAKWSENMQSVFSGIGGMDSKPELGRFGASAA